MTKEKVYLKTEWEKEPDHVGMAICVVLFALFFAGFSMAIFETTEKTFAAGFFGATFLFMSLFFAFLAIDNSGKGKKQYFEKPDCKGRKGSRK